MPYKPLEIEGMLKTKLKMYDEDADHKWFRLDFEGLPPIRTKLSRHKKDIGDKLEGRISKQLRVRRPFFHKLMDCTKSKIDYEKQVRDNPFPPFTTLLV